MLITCPQRCWCVHCAAAADFQRLVMEDPLDRRIAAALSPAVDPFNAALSRTPALSSAVTAFLGPSNLPVRQRL